ncbi:MAG: hypothetical protein D6693_09610 [Planctomycetota bacterium]|nr:MAG: hypothetical protein D6693_09610 [Planctomycetota bacterium]
MSDMMRFFGDPNARHAILVHVPIALSILGVLPAVALALTKFKNKTLLGVCVAWFAFAATGALFAEEAGEDAHDAIHEAAEHGGAALTEAQNHAIHEHEELGENGWLWPGLTAVVFAVGFIPKKRVAPIAGAVGIAASLGVLYWAAATGHAGGRLVYEMGVGAPSPGLTGAPAADRSGEAHSHEDEDGSVSPSG